MLHLQKGVRGQPGTGSWLHGAVLSLLVAPVVHPRQTYPLRNPPKTSEASSKLLVALCSQPQCVSCDPKASGGGSPLHSPLELWHPEQSTYHLTPWRTDTREELWAGVTTAQQRKAEGRRKEPILPFCLLMAPHLPGSHRSWTATEGLSTLPTSQHHVSPPSYPQTPSANVPSAPWALCQLL